MSEISVENVSTTEMDLNQDLDLGSNSGKYSLDIIDDVIIEEMEYPVLYEEDSDNDLDDSKDDFYKSETPGKDRDDNEAETCKSGTPDKEETCESGTPDKYGEKANFNQIPYGFQQRGHYEHNKMLTDLVDVTYNPRTREFIFLDTRGICTWNKDALENIVVRSMSYPKYQNRLLRKIIYARKYNVYFCLGKDFSLRVLNRDFDETCSVSSDLSSVMFILFNPVRDELITGGVKGTKVKSIRMISIEDQKNLSTVLPPPPISPLQHILAVSYLRELNIVYILIRPYEVWLYSTKSDPATRTHVWNLHTMQLMFRQQQKKEEEQEDDSTAPPIRPPSSKKGGLFGHGNSHNHRATATGGMGIEPIVECCSLCSINCPAMYWTEEGFVCADKTMFVLLGMQDGRVLFMDPNVFGMRHFVLQANKDGILDIRYNVADSMLITRCHPRDDVLFQCWRLPSLELLYEVSVATTITDFTIIVSLFLCGHSTGSVQLHELKRVDPLTYSKTSHTSNISDEISDVSSDQGSVMFDETGSVGGKKREHATAVSKVDACHYLEIFVTCSSDGMIKVWDLTKTLQAEIQVDDTLSTVGFLNKKADLLIGFRNHIFFIHHSKVCPSLRQKINQLPEDAFETELQALLCGLNPGFKMSFTSLVGFKFFDNHSRLAQDILNRPKYLDENGLESDIYEDPAVRYEGAAANPDPIDMQNYLVPFELDFTSDFLEKLTALSTHSTDELLFIRCTTLKRLKRRVKGSRVAFQSPDAGLHFEMPIFGRSPGPSPTPTPPSTPSDFSLSESESEEYDDEKEKDENDVEKESISETVFKPIDVVTQTTPAKTVKTPEAKVPKKEKKEESRFALSKYKVDIKGLMKADAKKASTKSSTKPSSSSQVNDKKRCIKLNCLEVFFYS
ncbi:uncharacterized protein LOC102809590 [Saccoglossus kowalevskii]